MSAQPMNRRSAVLSAAAAAAALPLMARAEIYQGGTSLGMKSDKDYLAGSDDALAAIAARANKANEEEKRRKAEEYARAVERGDSEKANALAPVLVGLVGGGSIVFSLPFFYKNLMRLGLRWASVVNKDIKQEDFDKNYNPKAKGAKRR